MYVRMHVCMYYVCMYVCTLIGAPIANRRADRRAVWYISPLEMCAVLLGGALGRKFGGSPQFLFVFYRPDRRENVRS